MRRLANSGIGLRLCQQLEMLTILFTQQFWQLKALLVKKWCLFYGRVKSMQHVPGRPRDVSKTPNLSSGQSNYGLATDSRNQSFSRTEIVGWLQLYKSVC